MVDDDDYRKIIGKSKDEIEGDSPVADHAGKASRNQGFGLILETKDGFITALYGNFGHITMNKQRTVIRIPFGGRIFYDGEDTEGEFTATIKGLRLGKVYKEVSEGKRQDIHPCKDGNDDKPFVESVTVEPLED